MQQIKIDKLPKGYFVTDTYYQSGNKEFVSEECYRCPFFNSKKTKGNSEKQVEVYDHPHCKHGVDLDNGTYCNKCNRSFSSPKEIFGTKHIQLIGANGKAKTGILQDGEEGYMYLYSNQTKISKKTYEEIKTFEEKDKDKDKDKDFFIYKISEEK